MRKYLIIPLFLVMIFSAAAFPVNLTSTDTVASPDDPAEYNVTVTNTFSEPTTFSVSYSTTLPAWFEIDNAKTIQTGESETFKLIIRPDEHAIQQTYGFDLAIISERNQTEKIHGSFTVKQPRDLDITRVDIQGLEFRPGERGQMSVTVLNTLPSSVSDYRVQTQIGDSNPAEISGGTIPAGSRNVFTTGFQIPKNATPGPINLTVSVLRNGEVQEKVTTGLEVSSIKNITRSQTVDNRILVNDRILSVTNRGNSEVPANISYSFNSYLRPLTGATVEPDYIQTTGGQTEYVWTFSVKPGETREVSISHSYWLPLIALVGILLGVSVLKRLYTPMNFTKRATVTEDGVKVTLSIENKSSRPLYNVKVKDFVPDIASVSEKFPMASPVIRKTGNGTRLEWDIEQLDSGDQRVFEYLIKPLVAVEGGVVLPEAEVETDDELLTRSSKVSSEFRP